MTAERAYAEVERLTRRRARNFAYGIMVLPRPKRRAIAAIYAFARRVDDIADSPGTDEEKREQLQALRAALEASPGTDATLVALADACERYPIPRRALHDLIDGGMQDTTQSRYADFEELAAYCRRVAGAVGIACVAVSLFWIGRAAAAEIAAEQQRAAQAVAERVREQAAVTQEVARSLGLKAGPSAPGTWDVDGFRKPRGLIAADGSVDRQRLELQMKEAAGAVGRTVLAAGALSLVLLLVAGLGGFSAVGSTLRKHRQAYLYVAPAMLGMLVLVFFPFAYGVTLSFTDSNLYNTSRPLSEIWVGLRNYADILGDFGFVKRSESGIFVNYLNFYWTLLFTILWTVTNVAIGVTSGLILALILNTKALALRPLYRVLLILPWAMPNYITALIWKGMFHQQFGVINQLLQVFGFPAVSWFDRPATSFLTALVTNGWLSFPFMMVVSLGALQSISADLYEAARVDGASRWQQFKAITLPSLRPALVPAVIISVVWTFNMFNIIYLVTGGEPSSSTEILVTQAYKFAFERYRYGYAAAYSTVIFGILLVYGVIQNRVSKATEA